MVIAGKSHRRLTEELPNLPAHEGGEANLFDLGILGRRELRRAAVGKQPGGPRSQLIW
jgi:hypothetical protein